MAGPVTQPTRATVTVAMTADEIKLRFPNASASFVRANAREPGGTGVQAGGAWAAAELERNPGDGTVGAVQVQKGVGQRFLVVVKSFRRRLLDEDNLCEKFHVDLCRYAGALPGDEAGRTKIEVCQEKVGGKEQEFVRIEVFRL